jgi:transcriptional regulator with XRE-family HTH domain
VSEVTYYPKIGTFEAELFGQDVRAWRDGENMSVRTFATMIGISAAALSRIERGVGPVSALVLLILCDFMDAQPWEFYSLYSITAEGSE